MPARLATSFCVNFFSILRDLSSVTPMHLPSVIIMQYLHQLFNSIYAIFAHLSIIAHADTRNAVFRLKAGLSEISNCFLK